MTCYEIRTLSTLGDGACSPTCSWRAGAPRPLPCQEDRRAAIQMNSHGPLPASGCRRVPPMFSDLLYDS